SRDWSSDVCSSDLSIELTVRCVVRLTQYIVIVFELHHPTEVDNETFDVALEPGGMQRARWGEVPLKAYIQVLRFDRFQIWVATRSSSVTDVGDRKSVVQGM